jgi:hypothetical protein
MAICQCPKCELKFSSRSEMRWHLREDHPSRKPMTSEPVTITVRRPESPPPTPRGRRWRWWGRAR